MKVFKFGGASVKDADGVRNIASILGQYPKENLVIVVSAMGKTTNALEKLVYAYFHKEPSIQEKFEEIKDFHYGIVKELFPDTKSPIYEELHNTFVEIEWQLEDEPVGTFDFEYDQMVSIGEMLSTKIVSAYLSSKGIKNKWIDVRDLIRTDNSYRRAKVDWQITAEQSQRVFGPLMDKQEGMIGITQGFVGSTSENFSSTLGREGSDFTAAILANVLDAEEVTIWKDVEGMLNADPKFFERTVKLNNISYLEAVELAYYGASVIHPKTIKPLQNKGIPLHVKSFLKPELKGSTIDFNTASDSLIPSYIHKPNQILISMSAKDYSFIAEDNLSSIYACFSRHGLTINLMQNAAISFSVCLDDDVQKVDALMEELRQSFKVSYNRNLDLLTVRHYTEEILEELIGNKEVLVEQKSRNTARFVLK